MLRAHDLRHGVGKMVGHLLGKRLRDYDISPRILETLRHLTLRFGYVDAFSTYPTCHFFLHLQHWPSTSALPSPSVTLPGQRKSHRESSMDIPVVPMKSCNVPAPQNYQKAVAIAARSFVLMIHWHGMTWPFWLHQITSSCHFSWQPGGIRWSR